jgi:hypothetical protein
MRIILVGLRTANNDHMGEAGLLASGRQTHPIGHLGANLIADTLLYPGRPH